MSPSDVSVDRALLAGGLPGPHKDPFDRMLIAQARIERMPVVTTDPIFAKHRVKVVW